MVITPNGVMLSVKEFEALPEYSCSLPTGQTIGKRWRRRIPYQILPDKSNKYLMGEYVTTLHVGKIGIEWNPILLPEEYTPEELR